MLQRRVSLRRLGQDPDGIASKKLVEEVEMRLQVEAIERARIKGTIQIENEDGERIKFLESLQEFNTESIEYSSKENRSEEKSSNSFASYKNQMAFNGSVKVCKDMIYNIEFHPSPNKFLACAGDKKGSLCIWDVGDSLEKSKLNPDEEVDPIVHYFKPFKRAISKIMHSRENLNKIYLSSHDGSIREFDISAQTFNEIYVHPEEDALGHFDFFNPENLWFSTHQGSVGLVDSRSSPKSRFLFSASLKKLNTIDINRLFPHYLVTAGLDHAVRIFDTRKLKEVDGLLEPVKIFKHTKSVNSAYWDPVSGSSIASLSFDDSIMIWNDVLQSEGPSRKHIAIRHNNQTGRWVQKFKSIYRPFDFNGHSVLAVGNMQRKVDIYNGNTGDLLASLQDSQRLTAIPAVNTFHPNPACNILLSGNASGRINVWM